MSDSLVTSRVGAGASSAQALPSHSPLSQPMTPVAGMATTPREPNKLLAVPVSPNSLLERPKVGTGVQLRRREGSLFAGVGPLSDVLQGNNADDCYLIASLDAIFALRREEIGNIVHDNGDHTYTVRIYDIDSGLPTPVRVDDKLPSAQTHAHNVDRRELWGAVVEKAYAVRYGGLANIRSGTPVFTLSELTGHKVLSVVIAKTGKAKTFAAMQAAVRERRPMVASIHPRQFRDCRVDARGLSEIGHAYTIVDVVEDATGKWVMLRNPMPRTEFDGRGYDSDWAPRGMPKSSRDGYFRMSFDDFAARFFSVAIVQNERLTPTNKAANAVEPKHLQRLGGKQAPTYCDVAS